MAKRKKRPEVVYTYDLYANYVVGTGFESPEHAAEVFGTLQDVQGRGEVLGPPSRWSAATKSARFTYYTHTKAKENAKKRFLAKWGTGVTYISPVVVRKAFNGLGRIGLAVSKALNYRGYWGLGLVGASMVTIFDDPAMRRFASLEIDWAEQPAGK